MLDCRFQAGHDSSARISRGVCNGKIPRNAQFTGFLRGCKSIDIRAALMASFHIVLRNDALVDDPLLFRKSLVTVFCRSASAMHFSFVRIFFSVLASQ